MISLRDVAKLVRESNSLIWPAAPTDLERVEAAVRWLRNELDDMKDRDAWRSPLEPAAWLRRPAPRDMMRGDIVDHPAKSRAREAATAWRWWGFEGPVLYTQRRGANAALCV